MRRESVYYSVSWSQHSSGVTADVLVCSSTYFETKINTKKRRVQQQQPQYSISTRTNKPIAGDGAAKNLDSERLLRTWCIQNKSRGRTKARSVFSKPSVARALGVMHVIVHNSSACVDKTRRAENQIRRGRLRFRRKIVADGAEKPNQTNVTVSSYK